MEKTPTAPPRLLAALAFCALALGAAPARAATLHVSPSGSDNNAGTAAAPYATIQAAVNNAGAGDTVALAAGTYAGAGNRDIDFGGKALTVRSDGGAGAAVLDCGGSEAENHRGFYFHGKEAGARVEGLTVKNGFPKGEGGAASVGRGSAASFKDCTFTANDGENHASGALHNEGRVTLTACTFIDNPAGGLRNWGTAIVTGCTFRGNRAAIGAGIMNGESAVPLSPTTPATHKTGPAAAFSSDSAPSGASTLSSQAARSPATGRTTAAASAARPSRSPAAPSPATRRKPGAAFSSRSAARPSRAACSPATGPPPAAASPSTTAASP